MCPWVVMDNERVHREIVKCVVVGDTAVGKTRLICARACNAFLSVNQLLSSHIPTVWAVDQYRIHKDVLHRSFKVVDNVNVSIRLWDTFGGHEKDRKFAYGRSDVVLLCFSVGNQQSLRNCKTKWYPEIRHNCPNTPIILVGCKNDLRHAHLDQNFLDFCRSKNSFLKIPSESEVTTRDQGRKVADEIGASYYETSVLTQYGVEDVFENAIRVALIARRQHRFWVKNLKHIRCPLLQIPYCPPRPPVPEMEMLFSTYEEDLMTLLENKFLADVKLEAGNIEFSAHKFILAAVSPYFSKLFRSQSDKSETDDIITITSFQDMKPSTMEAFLKFLYSGSLKIGPCADLTELKAISRLTEVEDLEICIRNFQIGEEYMNYKLMIRYQFKLKSGIESVWQTNAVETDVVFKLEDGTCSAHRAMLMARCDVMLAMFRGCFKESSEKIVSVPGVTTKCFQQLLTYIYTDKLDSSLHVSNCMPLLEIANKFCLTYLLTLAEKHIVTELTEMSEKGLDITEQICYLIEPCQIHNAWQLVDWCQYFITVHYQEISTNYSKLLRYLHPENQACLSKNRWPPVYYLTEMEHYQKCVREKEFKTKPQHFKTWKQATKKFNGCFSFMKRNIKNNVKHEEEMFE